jgi:uncharacterized protein with FMN-binding domain
VMLPAVAVMLHATSVKFISGATNPSTTIVKLSTLYR